MKLIIQVDKDGTKFAYMEDKKHYKMIQKKWVKDGGRRGMERLDPDLLNNECNLDDYEGYFVFDVKLPKNKKTRGKK